MVSSRTQPRQRGASLRSHAGDREAFRRTWVPSNQWLGGGVGGKWLGGGVGGIRGWFMNNVLSLQLARERAWQARGRSNGHAFKRLGLPPRNSEITGLDERRFLERLEAENAQLRRRVVDLVLQMQALRDGARTPSAYDAARHRRDVP